MAARLSDYCSSHQQVLLAAKYVAANATATYDMVSAISEYVFPRLLATQPDRPRPPGMTPVVATSQNNFQIPVSQGQQQVAIQPYDGTDLKEELYSARMDILLADVAGPAAPKSPRKRRLEQGEGEFAMGKRVLDTETIASFLDPAIPFGSWPILLPVFEIRHKGLPALNFVDSYYGTYIPVLKERRVGHVPEKAQSVQALCLYEMMFRKMWTNALPDLVITAEEKGRYRSPELDQLKKLHLSQDILDLDLKDYEEESFSRYLADPTQPPPSLRTTQRDDFINAYISVQGTPEAGAILLEKSKVLLTENAMLNGSRIPEWRSIDLFFGSWTPQVHPSQDPRPFDRHHSTKIFLQLMPTMQAPAMLKALHFYRYYAEIAPLR